MMSIRSSSVSLVIAMAMLFCGCSQNMESSQEKQKLMWVDLSANLFRFAERDSVGFYCRKVAETGMTAIVLDVKGTSSFVSYESQIAPKIEVWKGVKAPDFDYVGEFVKSAKENGLKIYCSLNVFAEGNRQMHTGLICGEHPEWQSTDYVRGKGFLPQTENPGKQILFVNPALPEPRKHICDILAELVTKYDIDGIILDRARYDDIESDFSDYSRNAFEEYIGERLERFPEDIYEWVLDNSTGAYMMVRGPKFKEWIEWRASVIYSFFVEARESVKQANPDVEFGVYTGAWYPTYYEVGVNWASRDYDPSADFDWATPKYKDYALAELFDIYTNGNYYPLVTLEEYRQSNGIHRNETDFSFSSGEYLCVEGACQYSRELLGEHPFLGGMYVEDYRNNPEQFTKAVKMNLSRSDGLMIFDIVHIINFDYWDELSEALKNQ